MRIKMKKQSQSQQTKDLLAAADEVSKLAAARRTRMAERKLSADEGEGEEKKEEAPAAEAEAAPAEGEKKEEEAKADDKVEAVPAEKAEPATEAQPPAEAAPAPAPAPAPVAEAAPASAAAEVEAADAQPPNGGFQGADLKNAEDKANLGEEDFGYSVPNELETQIEQGKAEDPEDESYNPGILIPPGLEDAVMAVADPAVVANTESTRFDLLPFGAEGATTVAEVLQAGAHWVLFANGEPLAKIDLADQENKERVAAHFVSEDYAKSVIGYINSQGLVKALETVKAKPYVAKIDENAKIEEIRAKLAESAEEELRQRIAAVKANFVENLGLVLEASASNFIVDNPLKNALIAFMASAGIPEATAAEGVDNAYFQHGVSTMAGLLDKADEWSNLPTEALKEITAAMHAAGKRARPLPSQMSPAQANPNYDQNLANQMQSAAVPATPTTPADSATSVSARMGSPEPVESEAKTSFRSRFGGFRTF